jgi:hypothetical protein
MALRKLFLRLSKSVHHRNCYRFNLEPIGYGNTLPERRDREDVSGRFDRHKSSLNLPGQEGEDSTIKAVTEDAAETAP